MSPPLVFQSVIPIRHLTMPHSTSPTSRDSSGRERSKRMDIHELLNNDNEHHSDSNDDQQRRRHHQQQLFNTHSQHSSQHALDGYPYRPQEMTQRPVLPPIHISMADMSRRSSSTSPNDFYQSPRWSSIGRRHDHRRAPHRPPRIRYHNEEAHFIWYHRIDLEMTWAQVTECHGRQFPARSKGALTCRYYRLLEHEGVEAVREQNRQSRNADSVTPRYGLCDRTSFRYSWMRLKDYYRPCLPEFRDTR
jgi:hypothetical protein